MIDNPNPTDLPSEVSVAEQAEAAGRKPQGILPPGSYPDLDGLREHVKTFMPPGHTQAGMMARAKAAELDFWLRSGRQKSDNDRHGT